MKSLGDTWAGDATGSQPDVDLEYDNSLRLTSETIDGDEVGVTYNDDDQATQIGDVHLAYDEATGDPESATAGDTTTTFDVDTRGNLAALASTVDTGSATAPVFSESVVRDELGRITQRTETAGTAAPATYGYEYDPAGRLTKVTLGGLTHETYGYDSSDGLISRGSGVLSSWTRTDGHGRPVELADGTVLEWSADGELLSVTAPGGAETQFGYDGFGRLVEVTLADGRIGRYRYDALGRRSAVRLDGQLVRRFVYGGAEFPRARVDADGDVLERYVYAGAAHVPDLIVRRDGQRLRLITDSLGSVRAVVDIDTGAVVQRLAYDAYGRTVQDTAPGTQPFGYKGAATDPVLEGAGLVWMGVRAYMPTIGRFTTVDSAGIAAGWNQHDALGGDPINLIDPDGRFFFALPLAVQAAVVVGGAVLASFALNPDASEALATLCVNGISDTIDTAKDLGNGRDNDGDDVSNEPVEEAANDASGGGGTPGGGGKKGGRGKNKTKPRSEYDHTVIRRNPDGSVKSYTTYRRNERSPKNPQKEKRYDGSGRPHNGVDTPHVHEGGDVRKPNPDEYPG